jgi:glycosyltransferase involved in cell wall biosynthesis
VFYYATGVDCVSESVTLGLCVKNSERTIQGLINSIINQNYSTILVQAIVVDGCSKDNTLSTVAKMAASENYDLTFYSDEGKGLGAARQIVVDKSKSKYIVFADGDVELSENFITEDVKFMQAHPDVGVAFAKTVFRSNPKDSFVSTVTALFNYAEETSRGAGATIFRTAAIRAAGGFDTRIRGAAEDVDLIARIQAKGWKISVNKDAQFFHKYRENFREFWQEQAWFGYGSHYFNHKNKNVNPIWRNLPLGYFFFTIRTARKAFMMTFLKASFLIPVQMTLGNLSWWLGFLRAHMDGYGHNLFSN